MSNEQEVRPVAQGFNNDLPERVSLRVRNFNSAKVEVNDADGNPVEIAAVADLAPGFGEPRKEPTPT